MFEIIKYGIITFACPVKVNIGLWAGLSQLLTLLNVASRYVSYDIRKMHLRSGDRRSRRHATASSPYSNAFTVVLRSARNTQLLWILQSLTAIGSFALYTFGTVVLAGMTFIPASDAIRATVVFTISAGFSRLVGNWMVSSCRRGNRTIVVDVPADCLQAFSSLVLAQAEPSSSSLRNPAQATGASLVADGRADTTSKVPSATLPRPEGAPGF